ncbi:putative leader peptide [Streptomyces sp. NPDC057302]|uniref:putative leader peptide n=1 Tax=Streptomyces sp. NPDC057302 TaxID=3346094 RepID=UPI003636CDE5
MEGKPYQPLADAESTAGGSARYRVGGTEVLTSFGVRDPALSSEELIDMRRLTKRRHIDLGRLSSAFCRR